MLYRDFNININGQQLSHRTFVSFRGEGGRSAFLVTISTTLEGFSYSKVVTLRGELQEDRDIISTFNQEFRELYKAKLETEAGLKLKGFSVYAPEPEQA
jgi:hypothetical protein